MKKDSGQNIPLTTLFIRALSSTPPLIRRADMLPRIPMSSSWEKPGQEKNCLHRAYTMPVLVKMDPLSPSTVPLCRKICWKASSLAMWRAPLPAVSKAVKWDFLNRRTAEPCFWMKLVKFPFPPRPSCCGFSRNARSEELVITRSSPSMSALFPPPTKASISLPAKNCSAVI